MRSGQQANWRRCHHAPKQCWELDYGLDSDGHRKRTFHKTEADADAEIGTHLKNVKSRGEWWARLPETERQSVEVVYKQVKARDKTLSRVWEDWQRWQRDNAQTVTTPKPYEDVVREWGKQKTAAGKTEDYVQEATDYVLNKFGKGREKQNIHEITAPELQEWLNSQLKPDLGGTGRWGLTSKHINQSLFSSLWDLARKQGWCSINICERLQPVTRPGQEVKIYPNEVVMNLLSGALENEVTQAVVAPLALGLFVCMRPEEVSVPPDTGEPFGWQDIDLKHRQIIVRRDIAKVGDQRVVRLQPCAWEWLTLAKKLNNPLPPINERRLLDQVCDLIGLDDWIRDGLRKCCATHLRAVYKNDYDVVKDCGNSVRILLKHYADLHTPPEISGAYWEITPEAVEKYRKTKAWKDVLKASAKHRAQLANENAKRGG